LTGQHGADPLGSGNDQKAEIGEKLSEPPNSGDAKTIARYASIKISHLEILRTPGNFIYLLDKATRMNKQAKLPEVNKTLDRVTFTSATLALAQDDFDSFYRILQIADQFKVLRSQDLINSLGGTGPLLFPEIKFIKTVEMFYSLPTDIKLGMALGHIGFLQETIGRTGWGIMPESFPPGIHQNEARRPTQGSRSLNPIKQQNVPCSTSQDTTRRDAPWRSLRSSTATSQQSIGFSATVRRMLRKNS
jgi:hypothetical protein